MRLKKVTTRRKKLLRENENTKNTRVVRFCAVTVLFVLRTSLVTRHDTLEPDTLFKASRDPDTLIKTSRDSDTLIKASRDSDTVFKASRDPDTLCKASLVARHDT